MAQTVITVLSLSWGHFVQQSTSQMVTKKKKKIDRFTP